MLFNSLSFALFLPIVFLLYWFATKGERKKQNVLLLLASLYFYSCWDYRFLALLLFSILLDYISGIKIYEAQKIRDKKFWLWLSIIINVGFLGVFKYFDFFAASFTDVLRSAGVQVNPASLNVILPIGISFYTFHGISYIIDIYKNKIEPERNIINYGLFVSFFPLLVAGPIERATHLLPQIQQPRVFNYTKAVDGLRQILWGLFKKIVIADNCAEYANLAFNNSQDHSGSTLALGAVFFAFQIYVDFSGYSDIALGTARLLGFELLRNFSFPYFSRDIAEFWRRWHISLTSWFRDYVYIPLNGSKGGFWMKTRNTFIIFIISGFWHGANWTFIVWGILNAVYFLPLLLLNKNRKNIEIVAAGKYFPSLKDVFNIILTFALTVFAWIFFRAETLTHAANYISGIFSSSISKMPGFPSKAYIILLLVGFFFVVEWIGREGKFALENINKLHVSLRWAFYFGIILLMFIFTGREQPFIYFQF